jgi:hypothetical protein
VLPHSLSIGLSIGTSVTADIPVDPDAPTAREWILKELGKTPYQTAKPTPFDVISKAIGDWLASLAAPSGAGFNAIVPLIVTIVVAIAVVAAFLVFGRPRLNRRRAADAGVLFGADDRRSAADLRQSAARAAATGDFRIAIEELFRALARQLTDRTIVSTSPGTTAQDFAARAARAYPSHADALLRAAGDFDGVRYLDATGDAAAYSQLVGLEQELRDRAPERLLSVSGAPVS